MFIPKYLYSVHCFIIRYYSLSVVKAAPLGEGDLNPKHLSFQFEGLAIGPAP
jgi:hypothetical protein